MGYDTYFTIRMEGSDEDKAKAIKEFRKLYDPGFFIEDCKTDEDALSSLLREVFKMGQTHVGDDGKVGPYHLA